MSLDKNSTNPQVDAELQTRIGVALALKQRSSFVGIRFQVRDRIATLWGEVPTFFDRQIAVEAVRRVVGLKQVKDELNVVAISAVKSAAILLAVTLFAASGCSQVKVPTVHPVQGQVTVNGRPLPDALVVLHPVDPQGVPAQAKTNADGAFELTTFKAKDGAETGEFHVTVTYYPPVLTEGELQVGPNVIPPKYSDPAATELKVSIHEGVNQIPPLLLRL